MRRQLLPSVILLIGLTFVLGFGYPLVVTGLSAIGFSHQADGSLVYRNGKLVGSSLLGQSFSVTASTRFMDWAQGVRPFDSTDFASVLAAGNQVIVSGYPSGSGDVATRVERIPTPASPVAGVQGVVSADNAPTDTMMTVAGVTVTLNPACGPAASPGACTQLFYFGAGAMPTLAGFFGAITPNTAVAAAFGPPGSSAGTITAAAAAVLRPQARWMR